MMLCVARREKGLKIAARVLSIASNRNLNTVKETFPHKSNFPQRHIGPRKTDVVSMLDLLGYKSLDELSNFAVPKQIQLDRSLNIEDPLSNFFPVL